MSTDIFLSLSFTLSLSPPPFSASFCIRHCTHSISLRESFSEEKDESLSTGFISRYEREKDLIKFSLLSHFLRSSSNKCNRQHDVFSVSTGKMVYGILLESVVHEFIIKKYDKILLQQVEEYIDHRLSNLNLFELYDDNLMIGIAEGKRKE